MGRTLLCGMRQLNNDWSELNFHSNWLIVACACWADCDALLSYSINGMCSRAMQWANRRWRLLAVVLRLFRAWVCLRYARAPTPECLALLLHYADSYHVFLEFAILVQKGIGQQIFNRKSISRKITHTWIEICASLNHRKKTKADGSRLIPRKHTETLVLLSGTERLFAGLCLEGSTNHILELNSHRRIECQRRWKGTEITENKL